MTPKDKWKVRLTDIQKQILAIEAIIQEEDSEYDDYSCEYGIMIARKEVIQEVLCDLQTTVNDTKGEVGN